MEELIHVTDEDEIASIGRNGPGDILGARDLHGDYWAPAWALEEYRAAKRDKSDE